MIQSIDYQRAKRISFISQSLALKMLLRRQGNGSGERMRIKTWFYPFPNF
jgi:hypothetical protein